MIQQIESALNILKAGGVILYPTDTIWGLGCDATNPKAVEKIYQIKKRIDSKSLIILVSNEDMVGEYVRLVPEVAYSLMEASEKPLTIIYPGAIGLAENLIAEDESIGIRVPNNEFCKKLINRFHKPIVSTSANISEATTPKYYEEISEEIIKAVDYIVDPKLENKSTRVASSIIKLGIGGEIKIIRE